jgi:uncharacterized protein (TIGR02145 family)
MQYYRYTLTNTVSGALELKYAPQEWYSDSCFWERSMVYWGIFRSFSSKELTFIKNGGEYLRTVFEREGTEAVCEFKVEKINTSIYEYEVIYKGLIDFSTYKFDRGSSGTVVHVQIIDNDFVNKIKTRESQAVSLQKLIGIDGNVIAPFSHEGVSIKVPSRIDPLSAQVTGGLGLHPQLILAYPLIIATREDESVIAVVDYLTDPAAPDAAFFKALYPTAVTINLKMTGHVIFSYTYSVTFEFKRYNAAGVLQETIIVGVYTAPDVTFDVDFNASPIYFTAVFATVLKDDYLILEMSCNDIPVSVNLHAADLSGNFSTITYNHVVFPDSYFKGYPFHEAFTRIIQAIAGGVSPFYSELLGRTDSEVISYGSDGALSLGVVCDGLMIRGFLPSDRDVSLNVCLKDLFTSLNAVRPLSLGVEKVIVPEVPANPLYNWYAVNTGLLAPIGWHIPSQAEWDELRIYVTLTKSGGELKEIGTTHWLTPNEGATDNYGFKGIGAGYRYYTDGAFYGLKEWGGWWTSTNSGSDANAVHFEYNNDESWYGGRNYKDGLSVRAIKDTSEWEEGETITDIDGNKYQTVKIGNQVWMAENLRTTKYNDGASIPEEKDNEAWTALTTGARCYYDNITPAPEGITPVVRIEDLRFVFKDTVFLTIEDATEISEEVASDITFSSLTMGFQKSELFYNAIKGRFEYNTTTKYSTPLTRQQNELTETSPYRADTNGIVGCLIKPKVYGLSENTTFDSDNFIINFVRKVVEGISFLQIARNDNYTSVGGVDNADNCYNLDYEPARNLRRWGSFLRGFLNKYTSLLLSFIANTNNSGAYSQRTDESAVVTEGADILISDLNAPYFENIYYNFNFKVTTAMIAAMNGNTSDYYGLVKFRNNANEDYKYGWIMKFESRKPDNKGLGSMKLLKSIFSLSVVIESYTDVSTEGGSDGSVTLLGSGGSSSYTYKVDSGSFGSDPVFTGLAAGLHIFTILDSHGATNNISITLREPTISISSNISVPYPADFYGSANVITYPADLSVTVELIDTGDGTSWAQIVNSIPVVGAFTLSVKSLSENTGNPRSCIVRLYQDLTNYHDITFTQAGAPMANISLTTQWGGATSPGLCGYTDPIHLLKESTPGNNDFSVTVDSWNPNADPGTMTRNKVWNVTRGINYKISVADVTSVVNGVAVTRTQRFTGDASGTGSISSAFINSGVNINVEFQY